MTSKIGSYAVALAILFASTAAFGQTETEKSRSLPPRQSADAATIRFNGKGVEFGPWLTKFSAQVRGNWAVPGAGSTTERTVDVTFYVECDGTIKDVKIARSSGSWSLDNAARNALLRSSPVQPLPAEFPDDLVSFTLTFLYKPETMPLASAPSEMGAPVIDNPRSLHDTSPALEVFTIESGTIYHRENCISLVGHRKVKVADRSQKNPDIRTTCWICQPDGPRDAPEEWCEGRGFGLIPGGV